MTSEEIQEIHSYIKNMSQQLTEGNEVSIQNTTIVFVILYFKVMVCKPLAQP